MVLDTLDAAQVQHYEDNGWCAIPSLLGAAELERAARGRRTRRRQNWVVVELSTRSEELAAASSPTRQGGGGARA